MSSFSCTKWGRWLPASRRSLRIAPQLIELGNWKDQDLQQEKWSDVTSPPSLCHGWLLHTVRISLANNRSALLCFLGKKAAKLAWLELSQGWYRPRIEATANALSQFDSRVQLARYCKTSKWKSLTAGLQAWSERLPSTPAEGVLTDSQIEVLLSARALAKSPDTYLKRSREAYVVKALAEHATLFEKVESMPLTAKQREACVIDDDNNLVLAGAGTGKTSTIMGRVAFLIQSGQAKPEEILLLAFGNKAAAEMRERLEKRLGIKGVEASTFHALGQKILTNVEGRKPSISLLAEDAKAKDGFVNQEFLRLQSQPEYRTLLLKYFTHWLYPEKNPFDFKSLGDYYRFLEDNEVRTLKGEKVKSFGECLIANFLFQMGVSYQYEATYQPVQRSVAHRAYKPDFYLPDYGIYIEHFGVDRDGNPAPYIDRKEYQEGMRWKRSVHKENQTQLIETFHFEHQERQLLERLKSRLKNAGVKFDPLPPEAILETLREFGAISAFASVLSDLLTLRKASVLTPQELEAKILAAAQPEQMRCALELLKPISERYEAHLGDDQIDFDDMIGKSLEYVQSDKYQGSWRFILVDEFQDISLPRAKLVKALRNQQPNGSLFCVGDDWQSIYRFAGSDIELTSGFEQFFGSTKTTALDKTFRFNSGINAVASRFVMVNPKQLRKSITSHTTVDAAAISLLATSDHSSISIPTVLDKLSQTAKPGSSVYLLARFKFDLPDKNELAGLQRRYSSLVLKTDSIHASKGKEADYVIVLGMGKGKHGLPSEMVTHPLVDSLLPTRETHPYAEERRLFYVALTRAKHRVYLISDMTKASRFLRELLHDGYEIDRDEFETCTDQANASELNCPSCKEGTLTIRKNSSSNQSFMGCSNYPRCDHTESVCGKCSSPMAREGRFKICTQRGCSWVVPVCPVSGGDMKQRPGRNGLFWACTDYRGKEPGSCTHTENYIALPKRGSLKTM